MPLPKLRKSEAEKFIEEHPWTDFNKYIAYFILNEVPFEPVGSKEEIEHFAEESKRNLEKYGEVLGINGDCDYINDDLIIGTDKIRDNIKSAVERCGPGALKVSMSSIVLKEGQPLKNALTLRDFGVQVTVRDKDESLRAISVDQRNEEGCIKHKASLLWRGRSIEDNYGRIEGYAQPKGKVKIDGYKIEWDGKDSDALQVPFVLGSNDYNHELWSRGKKIDDIIKERNKADVFQGFGRNRY